MRNYYEILEVSETASTSEIKKSYRILAKKYHPDQNKGDKGLVEKFNEINEAYTILSNEEDRKKYDERLSGAKNQSQNPFDRAESHTKNTTQNRSNQDVNMSEDMFNSMGAGRSFSDFFGFDPKTKEVNMNSKNKNTDAMRTEDAFKHIFGRKF